MSIIYHQSLLKMHHYELLIDNSSLTSKIIKAKAIMRIKLLYNGFKNKKKMYYLPHITTENVIWNRKVLLHINHNITLYAQTIIPNTAISRIQPQKIKKKSIGLFLYKNKDITIHESHYFLITKKSAFGKHIHQYLPFYDPYLIARKRLFRINHCSFVIIEAMRINDLILLNHLTQKCST